MTLLHKVKQACFNEYIKKIKIKTCYHYQTIKNSEREVLIIVQPRPKHLQPSRKCSESHLPETNTNLILCCLTQSGRKTRQFWIKDKLIFSTKVKRSLNSPLTRDQVCSKTLTQKCQ